MCQLSDTKLLFITGGIVGLRVGRSRSLDCYVAISLGQAHSRFRDFTFVDLRVPQHVFADDPTINPSRDEVISYLHSRTRLTGLVPKHQYKAHSSHPHNVSLVEPACDRRYLTWRTRKYEAHAPRCAETQTRFRIRKHFNIRPTATNQ